MESRLSEATNQGRAMRHTERDITLGLYLDENPSLLTGKSQKAISEISCLTLTIHGTLKTFEGYQCQTVNNDNLHHTLNIVLL